MNYTNYIINGNIINVDSIISNKKYLRPITITLAIPVTIVGIATFGSMLPITFLLDEAKYGRVKYLKIRKKYLRSHSFRWMNIYNKTLPVCLNQFMIIPRKRIC
jgi:hypothetical protein